MNLGYVWSRWLFNFSGNARREFYEDYASALRDNMGGPERLAKMAARARQRRTGWAPLYEHWLRKMKRLTFAHALQHTVPDYEVMVLTAAEEDGRMEDAMDYLAKSLRLSAKISSAYFSSLVSPVLASVTILVFFLSYALIIAPQNLETLPLEKWPTLSRLLYAFSQGLVDGGMLLVVAVLAVGWLVAWSRANWKGSLRSIVDRVPLLPWRGYRERQANNFLVSLAILLQSNNYGPKESFERMRSFAGPWLNSHLRAMLARLGKTPDEPARALDTGLFPVHMMDRIEDYAERRDFTKALLILAFDHADRQVQRAERQAMISGYLGMLTVGGVMGFILIAGFEFNQAVEAYIQTMR
ncbi:Type II secretory pathway, component PulF [Pseudomonas coronafaciens pv. garcae]|uniref:type II secretion system F family protein n=1 Tax=Pseudomonas syringae group TaxID=136849 RepID=UPI000EFEFECC|nr:type II secretion system F family protein [Pseudomonas coronafaciens]RMS09313.1 Type II secretory pathway, component PulF [Pseudomonas coronafaciens pv. garcae]